MSNQKHVSHLLSRMKMRGWSDEDITHAQQLLEHKEYHHFWENKFQHIIHWTVFFLVVVVNFFASATIIPLLVIFSNPAIYAVLMILGVCFGLLFAVILMDISHLFSMYRHLAAGFIIPVLAIINVFLMVSYFAPRYTNVFGETRHPLTMGLFYGIFFILPYGILKGMSMLARK